MDLLNAKCQKYVALYNALNFVEIKKNIFKKTIKGIDIIVNANKNIVSFTNFDFKLINEKCFVFLECLIKLLSLNYDLKNLQFDFVNFNIIVNDFKIFFDTKDNINFLTKNFPKKNEIYYRSWLKSGIVENEYLVNWKNKFYNFGFFENRKTDLTYKDNKIKINSQNFVIQSDKLISYNGDDETVTIPEGILYICSSCFSENKKIKKVFLPQSLVVLGGDAFYNCTNLLEITLPKNLSIMGNNPFAGCIKLKIVNNSPNFVIKNNALYTSDFKRLIFCSPGSAEEIFSIDKNTEIIGKHSFYLCKNLKKIVIPKSLRLMENSPFSGCKNLIIENNSKNFFIKDSVIYNKYKTKVISILNNDNLGNITLFDSVEFIGRNSFWNCQSVKEVTLPKKLREIGYNPFVGCPNIVFKNFSKNFHVVDGVLYNKDFSKIICYPANKAIGSVKIKDSVIQLERGAFSGCDKMTQISLHNINFINKNSFSNCSNLTEIYLSDFVYYIGEYAFNGCVNLKKVNLSCMTKFEKSSFQNLNVEIYIRKHFSNYLVNSENLFTLESMKNNFLNKIDLILIDPPYNSNINYIEYKDNYNSWKKYENFLYQRLKLSYDLLSNKGFLVITIDKKALNSNLEVCKQFFDIENIKIHKWKKLNSFFDANRDVKKLKKDIEFFEYIIFCKKNKKIKFNKIKQPYLKNNVLLEKETNVPKIFDWFGTTSSAKDEIKEIFGTRSYFSTPKPIKLFKEIIRATTSNNSIVLDFFAGSGTTGEAVLELNKENDNKNEFKKMNFILVTNNENQICEKVTLKRLKNCFKKYQENFEYID